MISDEKIRGMLGNCNRGDKKSKNAAIIRRPRDTDSFRVAEAAVPAETATGGQTCGASRARRPSLALPAFDVFLQQPDVGHQLVGIVLWIDPEQDNIA